MLTNGPDPISQMVEIISLLAPFLGDRGPPSTQSRSNTTVHHRSHGKCHPNYCQYSSRPQFSVLIVAIFKKRLGCNLTLIYASFPGYTRGLAGPMSISVMLVVLILLLFTTSYRRVFAVLFPAAAATPGPPASSVSHIQATFLSPKHSKWRAQGAHPQHPHSHSLVYDHCLSLNFLYHSLFRHFFSHLGNMRIILSLYVCFGLVAQVLSQELVSYWYEWIAKHGVAPYNSQGSAYQVYRNVKSFGAKGTSFRLLYSEDVTDFT